MRISVPDDQWSEQLADLDVEVVVWDGSTPQPDGHLDLVLWPYQLVPTSLADVDPTRIGLIQGQALGYDGIADLLPAGATYANAVGVHEAATAELAVALLLASARRLAEFRDAQGDAVWEKKWAPGLIDRRVLLLGVGGIGSEVAARLDGFGVELVRVGSVARDDPHGHVHGTSELPDLLSDVDAVVIAVPLTPETTGLVDAEFLGRLRDGTIVVNVARGKVVVTDAVVAEAGRITYASDVFDPEPLPADHRLWSLPNTIMTPHVGGMSTTMRNRVDALLRRQIAHLAAGEEPDDVVVRT